MDADTKLLAHARNLERQRILAYLERELFAIDQGASDHERGYRAGWNARAKSLMAALRSWT